MRLLTILAIGLSLSAEAFGDLGHDIEVAGLPEVAKVGAACLAKDSDGNQYFIRWFKPSQESETSWNINAGIVRAKGPSIGSNEMFWVTPRWLGTNITPTKDGNGNWIFSGKNTLINANPAFEGKVHLIMHPGVPLTLTLNDRLFFTCDGGINRDGVN